MFEFHKVIPRLFDPEMHGGNVEDVFDLVIPSIPGNGGNNGYMTVIKGMGGRMRQKNLDLM